MIRCVCILSSSVLSLQDPLPPPSNTEQDSSIWRYMSNFEGLASREPLILHPPSFVFLLPSLACSILPRRMDVSVHHIRPPFSSIKSSMPCRESMQEGGAQDVRRQSCIQKYVMELFFSLPSCTQSTNEDLLLLLCVFSRPFDIPSPRRPPCEKIKNVSRTGRDRKRN